MGTARVSHLRHVDVAVPNFDELIDFYGGVWGLKRIEGEPGIAYFAAEGSPEQFVYRVRRADEKRLDLISFGAEDRQVVDQLAADLEANGVRLISPPAALQTRGGGYGFRFFDPDGRTVEVSSEVEPRNPREVEPEEAIPVAINHVVLNSPNRKAIEAFYAERLGFKLSDWLPFMGFFRCNANHHSLAIADGEASTLNHVAFEVSGIDSMMRGAGRVLQDGRAVAMWGPGRHSAGDNTFYYFFDPEGNVSEYTAEVEQILDDESWTPREHFTGDVWQTGGRPGPRPSPTTSAGTAPADLPPPRMPVEDPGLWQAPPV